MIASMIWKWTFENWVLTWNNNIMPLYLCVCLWSKTLRQDFYIWNSLGLFNMLLMQSAWMMKCKRVNSRLQRLNPWSRTRMLNQWVGCSATAALWGCSYICMVIIFQMLTFSWIDSTGTCLFLKDLTNFYWRDWRMTWSRRRIVVWYWILIMMCAKLTHTSMKILWYVWKW